MHGDHAQVLDDDRATSPPAGVDTNRQLFNQQQQRQQQQQQQRQQQREQQQRVVLAAAPGVRIPAVPQRREDRGLPRPLDEHLHPIMPATAPGSNNTNAAQVSTHAAHGFYLFEEGVWIRGWGLMGLRIEVVCCWRWQSLDVHGDVAFDCRVGRSSSAFWCACRAGLAPSSSRLSLSKPCHLLIKIIKVGHKPPP